MSKTKVYIKGQSSTELEIGEYVDRNGEIILSII